MNKPCCADPIPVLSADGLNTVDCANCGATYVHHTQEYNEALLALMSLTADTQQNSDTFGVAASFKSLPNEPTVHRFAGYILNSCIRMLFTELAAQSPEKRNRMSITIISEDGEFNLTFAKGQYNNVMEDQRNEARAERDALRQQVDLLNGRVS